MQVFVPYASPYLTAEAMRDDLPRLRKQVIECNQLLDAISGTKEGWKNHPVTKMYADKFDWLLKYKQVIKLYLERSYLESQAISDEADKIRPYFLTEEFCDNHKRRLYTKSPERYPQFAEYGRSYENWYMVDGELKIYKQKE